MNAAPDEGKVLAPGTKFGRYSIVRLLGAGGMGAVYEAVHVDLHKRVALKTLHAEFAGSSDGRERFMREGRAASRIRHPNAADVTDVGIQDGVPYLVMEYLDGETLGALLEREGTLPVLRVADIMLPVIAAVATAHEVGIIHRDLKPDNIFLARARNNSVQPKVLDFGISKLTDENRSHALTATSSLLGTPNYMSPEQAQGAKHVDVRSDQYTLGVILYECATGQLPFVFNSLYPLLHAIVGGSFAAPRVVRPELPEGFERLVLRAMSRVPEERFPSLHHLAQELMAFASESSRLTWGPVFRDSLSDTLSDSLPESLADTLAAAGQGIGARRPDSALAGSAPAVSVDSFREPLRGRGRRALWSGGAVVLAASMIIAVVSMRSNSRPLESPTHASRPAPVPSYRAEVRVFPSSGRLELDGQPAGVGSLRRVFPRDGTSHTLRIQANGFETQTVSFLDSPPPPLVELMPNVPPAAPTVAPAPVAVSPVAAIVRTTPDRASRHGHHRANAPDGPAPERAPAPTEAAHAPARGADTAGTNAMPVLPP